MTLCAHFVPDFWEEHWIGDQPLCSKFPRLYGLVKSKFVSVADVFNSDWDCVTFRRSFREETFEMWTQLRMLCLPVQLTDEHDSCVWKLTKSGQFSVKSLYDYGSLRIDRLGSHIHNYGRLRSR